MFDQLLLERAVAGDAPLPIASSSAVDCPDALSSIRSKAFALAEIAKLSLFGELGMLPGVLESATPREGSARAGWSCLLKLDAGPLAVVCRPSLFNLAGRLHA